MFSDTHPRMEALQIKLLRETPVARKMEMLGELNASARALAMAGLRARHPADEAELKFRLACLLIGDELARKVYGDVSADSGTGKNCP